MPSFGMLLRVPLVRIDVSEERSVSIIRVTRIGELGTALTVTSNRRTLRRNTDYSIYEFMVETMARLADSPSHCPMRPGEQSCLLTNKQNGRTAL
jgi:hypothetical protein